MTTITEDGRTTMRPSTALVTALLLAGVAGACGDPASPRSEPEPEPEVRVTIVSGDDQEAISQLLDPLPSGPGELSDSLRVRVTDAEGRPLAGRIVNWTTTGGRVSPTLTRTDASGMAAAHWSLFSPNNGWPLPGAIYATASVDGGKTTFRSYARNGPSISSVSFSPDPADVRAGPALVTVMIRLWDDRRGGNISTLRAWFRSPTAAPDEGGTAATVLTFARRIPGAISTETETFDGQEWSGPLLLPADAAPGEWRLDRVEIGWGPGASDRGEIAGALLEQQRIRTVLPVLAAP